MVTCMRILGISLTLQGMMSDDSLIEVCITTFKNLYIISEIFGGSLIPKYLTELESDYCQIHCMGSAYAAWL